MKTITIKLSAAEKLIIKRAAREDGISMNEFIVRKLETKPTLMPYWVFWLINKTYGNLHTLGLYLARVLDIETLYFNKDKFNKHWERWEKENEE